MKRVNGSFYFQNKDFEMTLQIAGMSQARAYYHCFLCNGQAYLDFTVYYNGNDVGLRCIRVSNNTCGVTKNIGEGTISHNDDRLNFTGSLNNAGTMLVGYWGCGKGSFRSQFGGGDQANATSGTFCKF